MTRSIALWTLALVGCFIVAVMVPRPARAADCPENTLQDIYRNIDRLDGRLIDEFTIPGLFTDHWVVYEAKNMIFAIGLRDGCFAAGPTMIDWLGEEPPAVEKGEPA